MAHQYTSLPNDWGDFEPSNEIPTLDDARSTRRDVPTRQFLEAPIIANPYPGWSDARRIAFSNALEDDRDYTWYPSQSAEDFSDGGAYRYDISEQHSDPTNATAPQDLQPPCPISVESDLRYNSAWVEGSSNDPGNSSHPTGTSSSDQYLNPPTSDPSLLQLDNSPFDHFSEHLQPGPVPGVERPWYPGSRLDQPNDVYTYGVPLADQSNHEAVAHDEPSCVTTYDYQSAGPTDSLHPLTVSSEVIGSTGSETKHTYITRQGDKTLCLVEGCGTFFTGRYQSGNAARHYRQQHTGQDAKVDPAYVCRECNQHFKRPDARRKHEWRKHGLQDSEPLPRRHRKSVQDSGSHTDMHRTFSNQGTVTHTQSLLEEPADNMLYQVPEHWHGAHSIFATAKSRLGDVKYDYFCKVLLERCAWFLKWLHHPGSDLFHVFNREVRDLDLTLQLRFQKHPLSRSSSARGFKLGSQSYADLDDQEDANDPNNRGKAPVSRRASKTSSRFNPYPEHRFKKAESGPVLAALESFKLSEYKDLDCPIHKWDLVRHQDGLVLPCQGCAKPYMNGVRQHLLRASSQQHRGIITFIQRCETCKEDFVDEDLWRRGGHESESCQARSQPQGNSLISWARLYLKIFPNEIYVPSPYWNDSRFLPGDLVIWLRNELGLPRILPAQAPQHSQTPLPTSHHRTFSQHGPESSDNATQSQSLETEIQRKAALDILSLIASNMLAHILTYGHTGSVREQLNVENLIAHYHVRVEQLRQEDLAQLNPPQQLPDFDLSQTITPQTPNLAQQAHTPVIGGAEDFTAPTHGPGPFVGRIQISDSDMATQYSSQEHQTSDVSFGFPSSQTSHGYGNPAHADLSASSDTYFCAPSDATDYATPPHSHGQWLSQYDAYRDLPGSSRMPQVFATAQMFSDVDYAMASSPTESRYALSHTCADEMGIGHFDID